MMAAVSDGEIIASRGEPAPTDAELAEARTMSVHQDDYDLGDPQLVVGFYLMRRVDLILVALIGVLVGFSLALLLLGP